MVAVPTLLLNEAQVRDLVLDLEIRFLANRDPQPVLRAADRLSRFRPGRWTSGTRWWTSAAS